MTTIHASWNCISFPSGLFFLLSIASPSVSTSCVSWAHLAKKIEQSEVFLSTIIFGPTQTDTCLSPSLRTVKLIFLLWLLCFGVVKAPVSFKPFHLELSRWMKRARLVKLCNGKLYKANLWQTPEKEGKYPWVWMFGNTDVRRILMCAVYFHSSMKGSRLSHCSASKTNEDTSTTTTQTTNGCFTGNGGQMQIWGTESMMNQKVRRVAGLCVLNMFDWILNIILN